MSLRHRHKKRQEEKYEVWNKLKDNKLGQRIRLRGDWTVETSTDLGAAHGLDVEEDLVKSLTNGLIR